MVKSTHHKALLYHVENSWLELLNCAAICLETNILTPSLVRIDLICLREDIRKAKADGDHNGLERCVKTCQHLLSYYRALQQASGKP